MPALVLLPVVALLLALAAAWSPARLGRASADSSRALVHKALAKLRERLDEPPID